jgi:hypothetical protein
MSKVSSVGASGISRSSGVGQSVSGGASPVGGVSIQERFNFPEINLPERTASNVAAADRPYRNIIIGLFLEIMQSGVDVVPTKPRDHGGYIVEASFSPAKSKGAHPIIQAPIRGVMDRLIAPRHGIMTEGTKLVVSEYVDNIVNASTDEDTLRLLIVISHEFGHYISFLRGFHDRALQTGLHLMQSQQITADAAKFTWLVFREESTAWLHAKQVLRRMQFKDWEIFNNVKNSSLSTYLSTLKLEQANLDIYYKLSLLGDDFLVNCRSDFFQKLA